MSTVPDRLADYRADLVRGIDRRLAAHRRNRRGGIALGAVTAIVAALGLAVASPWSGGPSVVDRAAAAIAAPSAGQILYERIVLRAGGPAPAGSHPVPPTPISIWLDGGTPRQFRMTFTPALPGRPPGEVGGRVGSTTGLSYSRADDVLSPLLFFVPAGNTVLDPAAFVRDALTSGRAKTDGKATIRGLETVRIRVPGALLYVDAGTYRPVRVTIDGASYSYIRPTLPLTCITPLLDYTCLGRPPGSLWVYDFQEYRHLPRTAANRTQADIRASHPGTPIV